MTSPQTLQDPRPGFLTTAGLTRGVLARVTEADLARPTPCDDFDVDHLTGHILGVVRRISAVGRGDHFASVDTGISGIPVDELVPQFDAAVVDFEQVWADDAVLSTPLELPFATLPGVAALGVYISELTTHTWDLATALGVDVAWVDPLVEGALAIMSGALQAEPRGEENGVPFAAPVAVADDAPTISRLVAWVGRDPEWTGA